MNKIQEQIAEKMAVPVILKLLKSYTATDLSYAINNSVNLAKGLEEDTQFLNQIKLLTNGIPFVNRVGESVKKKKWILWFINNALKHKRPDLYNQIVYNEKGIKYITRQIRKIVDLVFG